MDKVIITGADGFVGSSTAEYFLGQGVDVLAVDIHDEPKRLKTDSHLKYLKCDITNAESLKEKISGGKYDTFLHFAWNGSAGPARCDYHLQMRNALDTVACLKAAKELGCDRFVCAGSIMEYEVEAAVHGQGSRPDMGYIYGMGKHTAHCLCKSVAADIGIDLIWPMITNAYGAGEFSSRFINTTLRKMVNREPLQFTAATQNYDFVYITDVARAFYRIAETGKPFCEYMIGSGDAKPLRNFILEMRDVVAPEIDVHFGDIPYTGISLPLYAYDTSDTERDCGFKAQISFREGVQKMVWWLRESPI